MNEKLITSERWILQDWLDRKKDFPPEVEILLTAKYENPVPESELGSYRAPDRRKCVTADLEVIEELAKKGRKIPGFLEAGPRKMLAFDEPRREDDALNVGVVTTGGLAPGLNSVVHSIVERHLNTYSSLASKGGTVYGVLDSFEGLAKTDPNLIGLTAETTRDWLHRGGSELGAVRYKDLPLEELTGKIVNNLDQLNIRILYVIGGDGSLTAAHSIATQAKNTIVVGIPKTMDNDVLWVWQSFGFNSTVERAAAFINTMHCEAEGTRRIAVLEFFGARSGFVAANAALAAGHVDLVMIPEVFVGLSKAEADEALRTYEKYLQRKVRQKHTRYKKPSAVVVIAEGVGKVLEDLKVIKKGEANDFPKVFMNRLGRITAGGRTVKKFVIRPRYYIRSIPANSHDQIYCKRLGALAVDNALAGYTDFMISQWLTEYVLVPLELVAGGEKHVPPGGIFWKQVVASTGQPVIERPHQQEPKRRRPKRSPKKKTRRRK